MALSWIFWFQQSMLFSVAPDENKKRNKTKREENCHAEAVTRIYFVHKSRRLFARDISNDAVTGNVMICI